MNKIEYPIDKHKWHPSLIPGLIVLISTYNSKKEPNIAPKSWIQMISIEPPIIMFAGGAPENTTEKNILETKGFAVNFVDSSIADKVFECIKWFGRERVEKTGFKLVEAKKIFAPIVDDCKAHLECNLYDSREVGGGLVIFGEIIYSSICEAIINVEPEERYELLDQILFLEDGMFSRIGKISKVEKDTQNKKKDDEWTRYVILLSHTGRKITSELIKSHVEHLKELNKKGQLVLCGPFIDYKGGMVIVKASSYDEAKEIAETDPFVKEGVEKYEIRSLEISCEENNHLGWDE